MAENLQTTRPADEGWTTVIRPKTGWFDIDLQELWRYRDLIVMFVKRNFTVLYKQTILGPAWIILNPLITTIIFIDEGIVKVDKPPKEFFANPENERLKAFLSKVL